jgi:hypothetical protein
VLFEDPAAAITVSADAHSSLRYLTPTAVRARRGHQKRHKGDRRMATLNKLALMACAAVLIGTSTVYAESPTAVEQAELAGLNPDLRAQVQQRATGGNSVTEVLQVMLLNNIKAKQPATQIVAMDWGKGVAIVDMPGSAMAVVHFDPKTLQMH